VGDRAVGRRLVLAGRCGSGQVAAQHGQQPGKVEVTGEARGGVAQQVALGAGWKRVGERGLGGRDVRAGAERRPQVQGAAQPRDGLLVVAAQQVEGLVPYDVIGSAV